MLTQKELMRDETNNGQVEFVVFAIDTKKGETMENISKLLLWNFDSALETARTLNEAEWIQDAGLVYFACIRPAIH